MLNSKHGSMESFGDLADAFRHQLHLLQTAQDQLLFRSKRIGNLRISTCRGGLLLQLKLGALVLDLQDQVHWSFLGDDLLWLWLSAKSNSRSVRRAENVGLGFWLQEFRSFGELLEWLHFGTRFLNVLIHFERTVDLVTLLVLDIGSDWGVIALNLLLNHGNRVGPLCRTVMEAAVGCLGNVEYLWVMRDDEGALR